jgi:hypothetical protein
MVHPSACIVPSYSDERAANPNVRVWYGATENGP